MTRSSSTSRPSTTGVSRVPSPPRSDRIFATMPDEDRKSTRLNSSHANISYAVFFFNETATTEIYTLSLHDALPIYQGRGDADEPARDAEAGQHGGEDRQVERHDEVFEHEQAEHHRGLAVTEPAEVGQDLRDDARRRSEEHTSELQSRQYLVCRLLF